MVLPEKILRSLQNVPGFDRKAFEEVHASGEQVTSIRINPAKPPMTNGEGSMENQLHDPRFTIQGRVPWSAYGYYLAQRPSFTFDPLFHAGCYYVQEASSMFLEQALRQTADLSQPLKVLDLCAAPGGKSTHIQSLISGGSLLVSNEVIKSRTGVLKQNIIKWGCENVVVTANDPQHFSKLEGFFDVIVVDAPCSGSGLFRKDEEAIREWSEENVLLCCGRQKRILADVLPALTENGILIYSTCSYSKEEDEDIADWLVKDLDMKNEELTIPGEWGIIETRSQQTASAGYRFFADKVQGEGFYLACFRKAAATGAIRFRQAKPERASAKERAVIEPWLIKKDWELIKERSFYAVPSSFMNDFNILKNALNIHYAGVLIGEIMKDKLVPDHALAQSLLLSVTVPGVEVSYEEAIRYLQKQEVALETTARGWQIVTYRQHQLGWINVLQNRINNYYPKEVRILKS